MIDQLGCSDAGTTRLLIAIIGILWAGPVVAGGGGEAALTVTQQQEAKDHFVEGRSAFEAGDYEKARISFQRAYAIVHSPEILYNIGRCHEKLGDEEEAVYHYEMYLRFYPTAEDAEEVRHRIDMLRVANEKEVAEETRRQEEEERAATASAAAEPPKREGADADSVAQADKWYNGLSLGAGVGAKIPVVGKWERPVLPLEAGLHLPVAKSLQLSALLMLGLAVETQDPSALSEVKSMFGLFLGARFFKGISRRLSFALRFGLFAAGLSRVHQDRLTPFIASQVVPGLAVHLTERTHLLFELETDTGVIFPGKENFADEWGESPVFTFALSGMLGVALVL